MLGAAPYNSTSALPYLFKVLSIAKALSVQAHPDKALAERLHAARPDVYKDDNHKPELACALTPFEAMCGFRAPAEIAHYVLTVPELQTMLGAERSASLAAAASAAAAPAADSATADSFKAALREAYTAFMNQPEDVVHAQTEALVTRLRKDGVESAAVAPAPAASSSASASATQLNPFAVAVRLFEQFPHDVGVFSPFLLNVIALHPGDAIFLAANEPHAYLSGDCMEVMACSDNVVRAGLTPKFKDVSTLCSMLTYKTGAPEVTQGVALDAYTRVYSAPVPEFQLQKTTVPPAASASASAPASSPEAVALPPIPSAAVLVVVKGSGTALVSSASGESSVPISEGQVWLQSAGTSLRLQNAARVGAQEGSEAGPAELLVFRSHANPTASR